MQVINYHRPIFGTFHAKFMIVDRRIALLQSSNIQDNDNLEMMVHVEGPIVDSFYDTALISWGKALDPPLPMMNSPAADAGVSYFSVYEYDHMQESDDDLSPHTIDNEHYDEDVKSEAKRVNGLLKPRDGESRTKPVTRLLSKFQNIVSLI